MATPTCQVNPRWQQLFLKIHVSLAKVSPPQSQKHRRSGAYALAMKKPSSINKGPWLLVRIEHRDNSDIGMIVLAQPQHTFRDLHEVIELGANRWDQNHLHQFDFEGQDPVGNDVDNLAPEQASSEVKLEDRVEAGDRFAYVFDFGFGWEYNLGVERTNLGLGTAFRTFEDVAEMEIPILLASSGQPDEGEQYPEPRD